MDKRTLAEPLQPEYAELIRVLENKPSAIVNMEVELVAVRDRRSVVAGQYQRKCIDQHSEIMRGGSNQSTPDMVALADQLAKFDHEISARKSRLAAERLAWEPRLLAKTKPLLDATLPALQHALSIIEAAVEIHSAHDKFCTANGLGGAFRIGQATRLRDAAAVVKRFIKGREK